VLVMIDLHRRLPLGAVMEDVFLDEALATQQGKPLGLLFWTREAMMTFSLMLAKRKKTKVQVLLERTMQLRFSSVS
jgi:hypothetical protein